MRILITSAKSEIAMSLASVLSTHHDIRVTDRWLGTSHHEYVQNSLDHNSSTNLLVRGMDAIVHVGARADGEEDRGYLDYLTRCTYNLLHAAVEEKVKRVVFVSTLALFEPYDETYVVTERWRPRPSTDPAILCKYLGEFVCREFAREHKVEAVVLRVGNVVDSEEQHGEPAAGNTWLAKEDLAQAVQLALEERLGLWSVFHIQGDGARARFPIGDAKEVLGFSPHVQF